MILLSHKYENHFSSALHDAHNVSQVPRGSEEKRYSETPTEAEQPDAQETWVLYVGNVSICTFSAER